MKRICALLLIIAMIFSLAGCGIISRAARKAVGDTLEKIAEVEKATPTVPPTAKPTPTPTITEKPEDEVTEEALIGIWELTEIEMFGEGARIIYDPRIYCDPPINMLMILNKNGEYSLYDEGEWSEDASWSIQDDYIDIDGDYVLFEDGYLNDAVELDENDDGFTYYIMRFTKVSNSTDIEAYLAGTLPSTTVEQTENQTTSASGVTPEFKATMDAYEEFFDEYIAFMKKYKESDNSTAMLADYLKFLGEYAEMIEAMDDIDDTELSTADSLYYAEVQLRISQKLLEAASDT